jgi:copper chaperone CopZ
MKTKLIAVAVVLLGFSTSALAADLNRLLSVKGMSCEACPPQVERELRKVPGVRAANVDLKSGQAKVLVDERVKTGDLVRAVNNAGFKAAEAEGR